METSGVCFVNGVISPRCPQAVEEYLEKARSRRASSIPSATPGAGDSTTEMPDSRRHSDFLFGPNVIKGYDRSNVEAYHQKRAEPGAGSSPRPADDQVGKEREGVVGWLSSIGSMISPRGTAAPRSMISASSYY
jgi:hypothetical protein